MNNVSKRLALALLGQALPPSTALSGVGRAAQRGVMASVISGTMFSAFLMLSCFGFYRYLLNEVVSQDLAIALSGGLLLLMAVIASLIARGAVAKVADARESISLFPKTQKQATSTLDDMFAAFLTGLCDAPAESKTAQNPQEASDDEKIQLVKD